MTSSLRKVVFDARPIDRAVSNSLILKMILVWPFNWQWEGLEGLVPLMGLASFLGL